MSKINEYPQAATINNNDLFVIDQESGGDHATKSASVSQIADKATSGVQSQIGSLSTLTTTDKSSIVGAVNEVNAKFMSYTPATNTVTITASAIGAVCMVFVNRGYNAYDASLEFITGGNTNNAQLVEKYKGSNITVTKTSGTEFTITAGTELPSSTVYLLVISGEWTISG